MHRLARPRGLALLVLLLLTAPLGALGSADGGEPADSEDAGGDEVGGDDGAGGDEVGGDEGGGGDGAPGGGTDGSGEGVGDEAGGAGGSDGTEGDTGAGGGDAGGDDGDMDGDDGDGAQDDPSAPADVVFSAILPNPDTNEGQVEYIELWNRGSDVVQLAGWRIHDRNDASYTFTQWTLAPGARVVVWSGSGAEATPEGPLRSKVFWWVQSGDTATLRDPAGTVVDWMAYGSARSLPPPPGFDNSTMPAAPPKGIALVLRDGAWSQGPATPGSAPGGEGGGASLEVANVPPTVAFTQVPPSVRGGTQFAVSFAVSDDNDDPVTWRIEGPGGALAEGAGAGEHSVELNAPNATGPYLLVLRAWDAAGLEDSAAVALHVRNSDLTVTLPSGGAVRFPEIVPGALAVRSIEPFLLANEGAATLVPRIDVSPFRNGAGEVSVDGNLRIGVRPAGSSGPLEWIEYPGPYTPLATLGPGDTWEVFLEIVQVPLPLAAGTYGTSFTVVEASP